MFLVKNVYVVFFVMCRFRLMVGGWFFWCGWKG